MKKYIIYIQFEGLDGFIICDNELQFRQTVMPWVVQQLIENIEVDMFFHDLQDFKKETQDATIQFACRTLPLNEIYKIKTRLEVW
jgi:hypothetical protein